MMTLNSGSRLGPYEIQSPLGAGGMGEVYRASDSRLGRDVAIKILPEAFAHDAERMARFSREAQVLAALNHPNIAHIYGLEETDGTRALVMELAEGPTLADRVARGPLALDEALPIALQIAEALEYAHERAIIHRDLKPANIKITADGKVKLLDFGLAKALEDSPAAGEIATSPTISQMGTHAGIILGTAAYMGPEQARGKPADRRADIWSFGCVLYEMLTGKQAFVGEDVSHTMAAVIMKEPDYSILPDNTPPAIRRLIVRCLTKDPKLRLQAIGEARITVESVSSGTTEDASGAAALPVQQYPAWRRALPTAAALFALLAIAALGAYWRAMQTEPPQVVRLSLSLPEPVAPTAGGYGGSPVAVSPDGTQIVYVASPPDKPTQLYMRSLDQATATPIAGTDGANQPFFSPDGQSIGFTARGKLLRISVRGGPVTTICDAEQLRGASWSSDNTIIFTPNANSGLARVSAAGGTPPQMLTALDPKNEVSHRWPEALPGGKAVLFASGPSQAVSFDDARIALLSLETGKWRALLEGGSFPRYVPTGHIVYGHAGTLMAVPFDLKRLEVTGPPAPVLEGVVTVQRGGAAGFAVSNSGMLVYVPGGTVSRADHSLVWVDRQGVAKELPAPLRPYFAPTLSPDGKFVAVQLGSIIDQSDVWVYELARKTLTRLTFDLGGGAYPVWTPDGKRIAFVAFQLHLGPTLTGLRWKSADNSGTEEQLFANDTRGGPSRNVIPYSFSPSAKVLLFSARGPAATTQIQALPLEGDRKARPLFPSQFNQDLGEFSPDGRWVVYQSDESGRFEIYVQPYPGPGGKWQISVEGGTSPRWARNGREIFFRSGDKMMSVAVETQPAFKVGTPRMLFAGNYLAGPGSNYDVTADGQHFLMVKEKVTGESPKELSVTLHWLEELRHRVRPVQK